jgi:hypothetical protein
MRRKIGHGRVSHFRAFFIKLARSRQTSFGAKNGKKRAPWRFPHFLLWPRALNLPLLCQRSTVI